MKNRKLLNNHSICLLVILLVIFSFYGCLSISGINNQVNNYHDEYKNIDVKSLRLNIAPDIIFADITNLQLDFYEEMGNIKKLYVNINRNPSTLATEQMLYLKTDNSIFKVPLTILKSNFQSENIKTETTTVHTDSTGSSTSTETGSVVNAYFTESFKTELNDEIMNSILKTKTLNLRLYSGSNPVSFIVNPLKLNLIKKLAEAKKNEE